QFILSPNSCQKDQLSHVMFHARNTYASAQRGVCDAVVSCSPRRLCPVAASMYSGPSTCTIHARQSEPRRVQAAFAHAALVSPLAESVADRPVRAGRRSDQTSSKQFRP
ncbi:Unknown protein, partial [Striga hermonthica]